MTNPTDLTLTALRQAAHDDVDVMFDAWLAINALAASPDTGYALVEPCLFCGSRERSRCNHPDPASISATGFGDPTGEASVRLALGLIPPRAWQRAHAILLQTLRQHAEDAAKLVGEPHSLKVCHLCNRLIVARQRTHKFERKLVHRACYDAKRHAERSPTHQSV